MKIAQFKERMGARLRTVLQQSVWKLRMALSRGRWTVVLALTLLAAATLVCVYVLWPLRAQVVDQRARLEEADLVVPRNAASMPPVGDAQASGAADFTSTQVGSTFIPIAQAQERTAILDAIYEAAPKYNIYLTQAQFHWADKPLLMPSSDPSLVAPEFLQTLEMVIPVKGAYKDVREFVADVLQHHPSLALDVIDISRETPTGSRLVVNLRFALYLRGAL